MNFTSSTHTHTRAFTRRMSFMFRKSLKIRFSKDKVAIQYGFVRLSCSVVKENLRLTRYSISFPFYVRLYTGCPKLSVQLQACIYNVCVTTVLIIINYRVAQKFVNGNTRYFFISFNKQQNISLHQLTDTCFLLYDSNSRRSPFLEQ